MASDFDLVITADYPSRTAELRLLDTAKLPALFAAGVADAKELAYLNDALATSLDGLIEGASLGQHLRDSLHNYAIRFRRAESEGVPLTVPRVAELLADPAFRPLDDWLRQRPVDAAELQDAVDQFLEQARQVASQPQ